MDEDWQQDPLVGLGFWSGSARADFEPIGNPSLEERASRAKMEAEHVEHVKPNSIETCGHICIGDLDTNDQMKLKNMLMPMMLMKQADIWMNARV